MAPKLGLAADRPARAAKGARYIAHDTNQEWVGDGTDWIETSNVAGGGSSVAYEDVVLEDSPLAYWPLRETSGVVAADASGNDLDLDHVRSGLTPTADGLVFAMDGGDQSYLQSSAAWTGIFNGPGASFTVEAWARRDSGFGPIAGKWDSATGDGWIVDAGGYYELAVDDWDTDAFGYGATNVPNGAMRHFVYVFEVGELGKIYVDGELYELDDLTYATIPELNVNDGLLSIGGDESSYDYGQFTGVMADVAIYDSALSAERIQTHYLARVLGDPDPEHARAREESVDKVTAALASLTTGQVMQVDAGNQIVGVPLPTIPPAPPGYHYDFVPVAFQGAVSVNDKIGGIGYRFQDDSLADIPGITDAEFVGVYISIRDKTGTNAGAVASLLFDWDIPGGNLNVPADTGEIYTYIDWTIYGAPDYKSIGIIILDLLGGAINDPTFTLVFKRPLVA